MIALHFVFDEFPGQSGPHGPRLVEVETPDGKSINAGEWRKRDDGLTELVVQGAIRWQPRATLPIDRTVLVSVRRRSNGQVIGTFPAYIDEGPTVCCSGTWIPDTGLDGPVFETFAWTHLPDPAQP